MKKKLSKTKMKLVTVSFVVRNEDDANELSHELGNLDYGLYPMGCTIRNTTRKEEAEVKSQVPAEVLNQ